jgi:hypothetical protein
MGFNRVLPVSESHPPTAPQSSARSNGSAGRGFFLEREPQQGAYSGTCHL